ncbi:MAG: aspartate/glutamate racemase family protein [Halothece sp. Uz-M2-17]|nr:aspartate/glutamate racemase family protein [Halothece sp. Uz-M2-17]
MKIKIINPNTTTSMTEKIGTVARRVASPETEILACNPPSGPAALECHYDEAIALPHLLSEIGDPEMDGYIIACFGDPGLRAARELTTAPVLGIAEAAMHTASFLATGFSIVTTLSRTKIIAEHLVMNYGMERHCRNIRAIDLPVLELEIKDSPAQKMIRQECQTAIQEDSCGAIVLGCAGMADLAQQLSAELGVSVIDGVSAAVKLMEGLVALGLKTSKVGDLAFPPQK